MHTRLILWSITAALAGFLFGFDTIVISGAEETFQRLWQLDARMHGLATGMALWGTVIGAIFGGIPAERYGRRRTLIWVGVLYFISAVGSGLAPEVVTFMIARFIGGLGVGAATVAAPMFISEIAPPGSRGRLAGMFQFNIVFGILVALVSNWAFGKVMDMDVAWRWMLGIEAVPALIYTLLSFGLPESPRWLIVHAGKRKEGAAVFQQINPEAGDEQIERLVAEVAETTRGTAKTTGFLTRRLRVPILLAILIATFNQFSGINAVFYFAPRLLGLAGVDDPLKASIALGLTNLIFTFIGLWLIDKIGRRALLYIGSFGYIVSLAIASYTFLSTPTLKVASLAGDLAADAGTLVKVEAGARFMSPEDRVEFDQGYAKKKAALAEISKADWYEGPQVVIPSGASPQDVAGIAAAAKAKAGELLGATGTIVLAALMAFIAAHAIGQGAVIWVFISEIFPNDHRAAGQALGSATHWVWAAAITTVFPVVIGAVGPGFLFGFFCFMMVLQLLWVRLMVPETKNVPLEALAKKLGMEGD
ncbi:sugar porter family MFS transporter [Verrucomicrobiaceae bacterium E54]|nr:sugar porter family MFS transporter [Verrucomicrobiaceae bacterium E54]